MNGFRWLAVVTVGMLIGAAQAQQGPPPAPVSVSPVTETDVFRTIELVGTVQAKRRATVAAAVSGIVQERLVEAGDAVTQGQRLVHLRDEVVRIEIAAAEARRAELEAKLSESRANLERSQSLFEKGRVSEQTYDADRHAEEALRQAVASAAGAVGVLEDRLTKKTIKAPFDGVVAAVHLEVGEWVADGGAVADVLELARVDVMLDLPERYAGQISRDARVKIRTDASPGHVFDGTVVAIIPDADPQAHTLPLKVEVANPDRLLHAGMFARATVSLTSKGAALLVPKDALVNNGQATTVFVVKDGMAMQVPVTRGLDVDHQVVVVGDIAAGQQVVVRGNERLRPGQPVVVADTRD